MSNHQYLLLCYTKTIFTFSEIIFIELGFNDKNKLENML